MKGCGMTTYLTKTAILFVVLVTFAFTETRGAEFRIENRVFAEREKEPKSQSLTLFHERFVYDFMQEPAEVTIFDKAAGRFVLLNVAKREKAEITVAEIDAFVEKLKQLAAKQKDPLIRFFADPKFEETFDAGRGELSLTSPLVTYRLTGEVVKDPVVFAEYREFSDGYSKLNAALNPGSRPPQARLQVNQALARYELMAKEVVLTLITIKSETNQKTVLRSEHDFSLNLTAADLDRIHNARESMNSFKTLTYEKFQKNRTR
jgi:hypothetical protein